MTFLPRSCNRLMVSLELVKRSISKISTSGSVVWFSDEIIIGSFNTICHVLFTAGCHDVPLPVGGGIGVEVGEGSGSLLSLLLPCPMLRPTPRPTASPIMMSAATTPAMMIARRERRAYHGCFCSGMEAARGSFIAANSSRSDIESWSS